MTRGAKRSPIIKREVAALAIAARDPRTSWMARLLTLAIVAYAVSPIDLIPDFIPVLGFLDELVLLPLALMLALKLIDVAVWTDARTLVASKPHRLAPSRTAATVVVLLWLLVSAAAGHAAWRWWFS